MTEIKKNAEELELLYVTDIIKAKDDETKVIAIGKKYCDAFIKICNVGIKAIKETPIDLDGNLPTDKDVSAEIEGFNKLITETNNQKKFTAKKWIDWAKKVKSL